ncbi:hypothetical protein GH742_08960 [Legionella sp. MW5194]|uniref:hypothetical protein n=1 Tax=Legionella sp. MW5194 TaxID=2662448 RepID=UPI00193DDE3D|nr:hypothetical protein [Legionella sp. MW5194]QRN03986.1 hypothetical protein GH742_08960 [Legionella sp. MW5194]
MTTALVKAFKCIANEQDTAAIQLVKGLSKEELEKGNLGVTKGYHLFDYAVAEGRLDVANAIVKRYAEVTDNKVLKPLAIDYENTDKNTMIYRMNNAPFMSFYYFDSYTFLVERQKMDFLEKIKDKSKDLRIMGVEKLLKLTTDPTAHTALEKALASYKRDSFALNQLEHAITTAKRVMDPEDKRTLNFRKAEACLSTSKQLDERCDHFRDQSHYSHQSLESFNDNINGILKSPGNEVLKRSRGPGEILASIGNFVLRYLGIGFAMAEVQGKSDEYKQRAWDIFNRKTASETQISDIEEQASSMQPKR